MGNCKICGAPFDERSIGYAISFIPRCGCGKMRDRLRREGCISCGHKIIDLTLHFGEYTAKCRKCGREWWVLEV